MLSTIQTNAARPSRLGLGGMGSSLGIAAILVYTIL